MAWSRSSGGGAAGAGGSPSGVDGGGSGGGPRRVLVTLGYSAWDGGQLESEIAGNSWLTVDADANLIFDTPIEQRYESALALLGLQAWRLAPEAGHA